MKELMHMMEIVASLEQDIYGLKLSVQRLFNVEIEKDLVAKDRLDTTGEYRHGPWMCEGLSPTSYCIYDHILDPPHDNCLYCGQPEERK